MITDEGFVDFKCPHCGQNNSFPQVFVGSVQECVNCLDSLIVPEPGNAVARQIPLPISTPSLRLRRLNEEDWRELLEFFDNDEQSTIEWLNQDQMVKLTSRGHWYNLGIEVQSTGKIVGYTSMRLADHDQRQATATIVVSKQLSDMGPAVEAIRGLLGFCFRDLNLHRVVTSHDIREKATVQLFEEAGMRREGEFRKDHEDHGEWFDTIYLAILREEFHKT